MPYFHSLGELPTKRRIQFRRPDGTFYSEEVFGTEGFVGATSTLYHRHPPTQTALEPNDLRGYDVAVLLGERITPQSIPDDDLVGERAGRRL